LSATAAAAAGDPAAVVVGLAKKGRLYTAEEDEKIVEGVRRFGNDWGRVVEWAKLDRTREQVASRSIAS
jgi:hypothetical protein